MNQDFKTLIKNPTTIKFSDTIPIRDSKVKEMSLDTFISLAQSKGNSIHSWSEAVDFCSETKQFFSRLKNPPDAIKLTSDGFQNLLIKSQAVLSNLVICDMGDPLRLGFGVCTLKPLEKGEFIGFYAGRVGINDIMLEEKEKNLLSYGLRLFLDVEADQEIGINSYKTGNITRFFQHAFDANNAAEYLAHYDVIDQDHATANLDPIFYSFDNLIFIGFETNRKIPKNAMLFFDYGPRYWEEMNIRPNFFNNLGLPLNSKCKGIQLEIFGQNKIFEMGDSLLKIRQCYSLFMTFSQIYVHIREEKLFSVKNTDVEFTVESKLFAEHVISNPYALIWRIIIPNFKHPTIYRECMVAVLRHQTGIEWKYNNQHKKAFAVTNNSIFNYLRMYGFNIQLKVNTLIPNRPVRTMLLDLSKEADHDKLTQIPRIIQGPELPVAPAIDSIKTCGAFS